MPLSTEPPRPVVSSVISAPALPVPPPPGPPPSLADIPALPIGFSAPTIGPVLTAPAQPRPIHPLPSKPAPAPVQTVISGEAQIRDLKAEATSFVPTALKRKRDPAPKSTATATTSSSGVNAAPQKDDEVDEEEQEMVKRPSLLGELDKAGLGKPV
jgi:hypothetical protein